MSHNNGNPTILNASALKLPSQAMMSIYRVINKIAQSGEPVLITGETGTGKEIIAKMIHSASLRSQEKFVAINCTAIPETLLESELFGYEQGAFSGAVKKKIGLFESASEGTLFLDEIGDMPTTTQAKILRVLEESKIRRVGGVDEVAVDLRIITATNKILTPAVKNREFREDLYYRLNTFFIDIPPLRERKEDILPLVEYLTNSYNQKNKEQKKFDIEVLATFYKHEWPGNIRELKHTVDRLLYLSDSELITRNNLIYTPHGFNISESGLSGLSSNKPSLDRGNLCAMYGDNCPLKNGSLDIKKMKYFVIDTALVATGRVKDKAIKLLGVNRKTFYNIIKKRREEENKDT